MVDGQVMETILSDATVALKTFDFTKLEFLERQLSELAKCGLQLERDGARSILQKMRVLELFLQNCDANLNTLKQLHTRHAGISWVR